MSDNSGVLQKLRQRTAAAVNSKENDDKLKDNANQDEDEQGTPVWVELLRCIVLVVVFFVLYLPTKYFMLDPYRGVPPPVDEMDLIRDKICPPGQECEFDPSILH